MLAIIQLIIFGHIHKWEIIDKWKRTFNGNDFISMRYILQCKECGNIKSKKS